jgi:hypothetical protein
MSLEKAAIIKQIDEVLAKCDLNASTASDISKVLSLMLSAIRRLAPPGSVYDQNLQRYEAQLTAGVIAMSVALEPVHGMLQALRSDYESGHLASLVELVHADIFADFLDMAQYLLEQNYKDPAAVVTGSVLEAHLRELCDKHTISVNKADGSQKKADTLNSELGAANIYTKLDQKSITAWLDLRNKAAHGKYAEYTKEQVTLMLQGVRDFSARHPA